MKNLLALRPYFLRYRKSLSYGIICVIATNFFAVAAPRYLGEAIDLMGKPFEMQEILHKAGLYILFAALSGITLYLVRQLIIVTSRHIEFDLKNDYYAHLQTLSTSFYDTTGSGELISRGTNDLNAIRDFLGPGIMYSINTLFRLLFAMGAMLSISPLLTLFALLHHVVELRQTRSGIVGHLQTADHHITDIIMLQDRPCRRNIHRGVEGVDVGDALLYQSRQRVERALLALMEVPTVHRR